MTTNSGGNSKREQRQTSSDIREPRWAFMPNAPAPDPVIKGEVDIPSRKPTIMAKLSDYAWRELLFAHMPHHLPDETQHEKLIEAVRHVEREAIREENFTPADPILAERHRRILAHERLRLMERAYIMLRLDRYANAPANRGWMNLFRTWARVSDTDTEFQLMEPKFSTAFVHFYATNVRNHAAIDVDPVRHPWDSFSELDPSLREQFEQLLARLTQQDLDLDVDVPAPGGTAQDAENLNDAAGDVIERDRATRATAETETETEGLPVTPRAPVTLDTWWKSRQRHASAFLDTGSVGPYGSTAAANDTESSKSSPDKERVATDKPASASGAEDVPASDGGREPA